MAEAYCVKDKQKVEVQNPQRITMKNGKPALQGTCPKCGGKVFKIGGWRRSDPTPARPCRTGVFPSPAPRRWSRPFGPWRSRPLARVGRKAFARLGWTSRHAGGATSAPAASHLNARAARSRGPPPAAIEEASHDRPCRHQ